ncbi:hypothetical protein ACOBQJ_00305 [Pelotomaculum propionicicum]|uniref:hypothetical protein n=1 Tax=Pelotomaculum propionicicum TaxID=258475 RepID=UPI003B78BC63
MTFIANLFTHRGSEVLVREQVSFFIRDAQNTALDIGKLIQEIINTGHPDITNQCSRLAQLNSQLGKTLEQAQKSIN